MENTMMMPANYMVMSEEEMTYTEGGATMTEALLAWLIPPYGWYKGITGARAYRKAHPDNWLETGMDALSADMEKSAANAIYDIACAAYVISTTATGIGAIINAVILFT